MGEAINVVVAFAVIFFLVRWATRGSDGAGAGDDGQRRARELLGFQPKNVTPEMISTVQTMFPDIPRDNIQYDLLKTGNVQMTSNKLLERGYLDTPPAAYFQLYPTQPAAVPASPASSAQPEKAGNLIMRYGLEGRVHAKEREEEALTEETAGGGSAAMWEDTAARREQSLRERKAQMVLAARRRFLEQEAGGK